VQVDRSVRHVGSLLGSLPWGRPAGLWTAWDNGDDGENIGRSSPITGAAGMTRHFPAHGTARASSSIRMGARRDRRGE